MTQPSASDALIPPASSAPPAAVPPSIGLTAAEAQQRAAQGRVNTDTTEQISDWAVVRRNLLSFFNIILFSLIAILLAVGEFRDGLFVGIVVAANVAIATFQELRAVHILRDLRALNAPRASVIRDGQEQSIPAEEVVEGDAIRVRQGEQIVADGKVITGRVEVDESLLTGETDSVRKGSGDLLYAGSYVLAGEGIYTAEKVGADAYMFSLTATAKQKVKRTTPLQQRFNRLLRVLLVATGFLGILLMISFENEGRDFADAIKAVTATLTSIVPEGLLLGLTVAFSVGAVAVSRARAIVQDINAVEALNYVDVICLDKTGTITANALRLEDIVFATGMEGYRPWLAAFATEATGESKTVTTIAEALRDKSNGATTDDQVPFNSERRWSARRLAKDGERRTFILGAPETVLPRCDGGADLQSAYQEASHRGLRGVVFAEAHDMPVPGVEDRIAGLRPIALIILGDELRPRIQDTFAVMREKDIAPKVISGDNPNTVAALLRQIDVPIDGAISGDELEALDDEGFARAVEENTVFGRINPPLKSRIVDQLKANDHFVAMVGDGANDVQALRKADVAVAMESGTATTRAVAQFVLLDDSFHAFIRAIDHAETVLGNSARLSKLFITKSIYAFILIFATNMLSLEFPFLPRQGTLTTLFTLGIPTVIISIGRPPPGSGRNFEASVLGFAVPAAISLAISASTVHLLADGLLNRDLDESRTLVSVVIAIVGIIYVLEVLGFEGASFKSLTRPVMTTLFCASLIGALLVVIYTPWLREFFDLVEMGPGQWAIALPAIAAAVAGQYALTNHWQQITDFLLAKPKKPFTRGRPI